MVLVSRHHAVIFTFVLKYNLSHKKISSLKKDQAQLFKEVHTFWKRVIQYNEAGEILIYNVPSTLKYTKNTLLPSWLYYKVSNQVEYLLKDHQ